MYRETSFQVAKIINAPTRPTPIFRPMSVITSYSIHYTKLYEGLAAAAKKAGRVAAEGLVGVASSGTKAAVVEINSETDFVARNEIFQTYVVV